MKQRDLMIGDWVYSTFSDKPCQVLNFEESINGYGIVKVDNVYGVKDIASISPIPLTYEFLRKIFPNINDGVYWCARKGKYEVRMENGDNKIKVLIEYVHELQHALRLCGIEKEVEL